jgi:hypothetical protein
MKAYRKRKGSQKKTAAALARSGGGMESLSGLDQNFAVRFRKYRRPSTSYVEGSVFA